MSNNKFLKELLALNEQIVGQILGELKGIKQFLITYKKL
ncbi:hypothetical protein B4064_3623 [Caldibacillus thermoamylovorans]|nr:hypothetical protein B4064_3623 [Caldibacillus thermoamylovorans]